MKKLISVLTALAIATAAALTLSSCDKEPAESDQTEPAQTQLQAVSGEFTAADILAKIKSEFTMDFETIELYPDDMLDFYGIESEKIAELAGIQNACGYKDEIVIIKAVDENAADEIEDIFEQHIEDQKKTMKNYDPEQYQVLGSSIAEEDGVWVALFVSEDQAAMLDVYNSYVK